MKLNGEIFMKQSSQDTEHSKRIFNITDEFGVTVRKDAVIIHRMKDEKLEFNIEIDKSCLNEVP